MSKIAIALVALASAYVPSAQECAMDIPRPEYEIRKAGFSCASATGRTLLDESFADDSAGYSVAYYCDGTPNGDWFKLSFNARTFGIAAERLSAPPGPQACPASR